MKIFRLGACLKCCGDLAYDEGDWICLQCGVYYYTGLYDRSESLDDGTLRIGRIYPGLQQGDQWTDIALAG